MSALDPPDPLENLFAPRDFVHPQVLQIGSEFLYFSLQYDAPIIENSPGLFPLYTKLPGVKDSLRPVPFPRAVTILDYDSQAGTLTQILGSTPYPTLTDEEESDPANSTTASLGNRQSGFPFKVFAHGNLVILFRYSSQYFTYPNFSFIPDTDQADGQLGVNLENSTPLLQDTPLLVDFFYFDGEILTSPAQLGIPESTVVLRFLQNVKPPLLSCLPLYDVSGSISAWRIFTVDSSTPQTAAVINAWYVSTAQSDGQFLAGATASKQTFNLGENVSITRTIENVLYEEALAAGDDISNTAQPGPERKHLLLAFGITPSDGSTTASNGAAKDQLCVIDFALADDGSLNSFSVDANNPIPDVLQDIQWTQRVEQQLIEMGMLEKEQISLSCYLHGRSNSLHISAIKPTLDKVNLSIMVLRNKLQSKYAARADEIQLKTFPLDETIRMGTLGYIPKGSRPILFASDPDTIQLRCRGPYWEFLDLTLDSSVASSRSVWRPSLQNGNSVETGIREDLRDSLLTSRELTVEFTVQLTGDGSQTDAEIFELSRNTWLNSSIRLMPTTTAEKAEPNALAAAVFSPDTPLHMDLPEASELGIEGTSFTVQAWVKLPNVLSMSDYIILAQRTTERFKNLHLVVRKIQNVPVAYFGFYGDDLAGRRRLESNRWYLLTFRYDYSSRRRSIFIDGELDSWNTAGGHWSPASGDNLMVAKYVNGRHYVGHMSDLRIFNYARTDVEIKATYDWLMFYDELTAPGSGTGMVGWVDFGTLAPLSNLNPNRPYELKNDNEDAVTATLESGPVITYKLVFSSGSTGARAIESNPIAVQVSHKVNQPSTRHISVSMPNKNIPYDYNVFIDGTKVPVKRPLGTAVFSAGFFERADLTLLLAKNVQNAVVSDFRLWSKAFSREEVLSKMFKKFDTKDDVGVVDASYLLLVVRELFSDYISD